MTVLPVKAVMKQHLFANKSHKQQLDQNLTNIRGFFEFSKLFKNETRFAESLDTYTAALQSAKQASSGDNFSACLQGEEVVKVIDGELQAVQQHLLANGKRMITEIQVALNKFYKATEDDKGDAKWETVDKNFNLFLVAKADSSDCLPIMPDSNNILNTYGKKLKDLTVGLSQETSAQLAKEAGVSSDFLFATHALTCMLLPCSKLPQCSSAASEFVVKFAEEYGSVEKVLAKMLLPTVEPPKKLANVREMLAMIDQVFVHVREIKTSVDAVERAFSSDMDLKRVKIGDTNASSQCWVTGPSARHMVQGLSLKCKAQRTQCLTVAVDMFSLVFEKIGTVFVNIRDLKYTPWVEDWRLLFIQTARQELTENNNKCALDSSC